MKPILEASKQERCIRALHAIEAISMLHEAGEDDERFLNYVYCISHVGSSHCGNPHEDWLKLIEEVEEMGRKNKTYSPEKSLEEFLTETEVV